MAEAPRNTSVLQGQAFGGGAIGGLAAGITGGLIGGFPEAAAAYKNVTGAVQQEQRHQADLMAKYADLELKSRDLQQRDMEISVLQEQQDGKIAQARSFSQRAVADLGNIDTFINIDKNKAVAQAIDAQRSIDDSARSVIAQAADTVFDEISHQKVYGEFERIADQAGSTVENLFPGMTREWQGKKTRDAYRAAKSISAASQQVRETERLENFKHDKEVEVREFMKEADLEKQYRGFIYDSLLQQQQASIRAELAALQEKPKDKLSKSDLESIKPAQVAGMIELQLSSISKYYTSNINNKDFDEELAGIASEAATIVSNKIDQGRIAYNEGIISRPITQGEAILAAVDELVSRMGTDGKVYPENSAKLQKMKQDFIKAFIHQSEQHPIDGAEFKQKSPEEKARWALLAWSNKKYRMENDQK